MKINLMGDCRKIIAAHFPDTEFSGVDVYNLLPDPKPPKTKVLIRLCQLKDNKEIALSRTSEENMSANNRPVNVYRMLCLRTEENKPKMGRPKKERSTGIKAHQPAGMFLLALRAGQLEFSQVEERFVSCRPPIARLLRLGYIYKTETAYRLTELGKQVCPTRRKSA